MLAKVGCRLGPVGVGLTGEVLAEPVLLAKVPGSWTTQIFRVPAGTVGCTEEDALLGWGY